MGRGDGEVEHRIDARIRQQRVDAQRPCPLRVGDGCRARRVEVGDACEAQVREVRELGEVLVADDADADDADVQRAAHSSPLSMIVRTFGFSTTSSR